MATLAQFGIVVPPVEGADAAKAKLAELGTAGAASLKKISDATGNVSSSVKKVGDDGSKGFNTLTNSINQNYGGLQTLLRAIGPLGGEMTQMASYAERAGLAIEHIGAIALPLIGILAAIAIAIKAAGAAWKFFTESLAAAGAEQSAALTLKNVTGNAQAAAQQIEQLKSFEGFAGIFKLDDLIKTNIQLQLLGVNVLNASQYTKGLSVVVAEVGGTLSEAFGAFQQIVLGRFRAVSEQSEVLLRQIATNLGKPFETIEQTLNKMDRADAVKAASDALFSLSQNLNPIIERQKTWDGQIATLRNKWDELKRTFGEPIIIALSPLLDTIAQKLTSNQSIAEEWGNKVAAAITDIANAAKTGHLTQTFEDLGDKLGNAMIDGIVKALSKLGDKIGEKSASSIQSFINNFGSEVTGMIDQSLGTGLSSSLTRAGGGPPGILTGSGSAPGLTNPTPSNEIYSPAPVDQYSAAVAKATNAQNNLNQGLKQAKQAADDFKSDLSELNNYWYEYTRIQGESSTPTENTRRTIEAATKALTAMKDPLAHVNELTLGMSAADKAMVEGLAKVDERLLETKRLEDELKAGTASFAQSVEAGFRKFSDSIGTWQTQIADATQKIAQALGSDISSGLTDILDGTKSVSQGFRDMALSIIKDIEKIIIEMLVMKAIQATLGGVFGGGGSIGTFGTSSFSQGSTIIAGGAHSGWNVGQGAPTFMRVVDASMFMGAPRLHSGLMSDEFPAILQRGEQVIPRGGTAGGQTQVNISIVNKSDGTKEKSVQTSGADARELGRMTDEMIDQWAAKRMRRGGILENVRRPSR